MANLVGYCACVLLIVIHLSVTGPEEDIPRKMEFLDFVCHAPSDYFRARNTPYPLVQRDPDLCFIWTSLGPEIRTTPSVDEIFGVKDEGEESALSSDAAASAKGTKDKEGNSKDKSGDREDRKAVKMEMG